MSFSVLGSILTPDDSNSVIETTSGYAYVVDSVSATVKVYNISTNTPSLVGTLSIPGLNTNASVVKYFEGHNVLFIINSPASSPSLLIVSVSNPAAPTLVSTTPLTSGLVASVNNVNGLQVRGSHVFFTHWSGVFSGDGGYLLSYDISNSSEPQRASEVFLFRAGAGRPMMTTFTEEGTPSVYVVTRERHIAFVGLDEFNNFVGSGVSVLPQGMNDTALLSPQSIEIVYKNDNRYALITGDASQSVAVIDYRATLDLELIGFVNDLEGSALQGLTQISRVIGDYMYVARDGGLTTLDISSVQTGSISIHSSTDTTEEGSAFFSGTKDFAIQDSKIYMAVSGTPKLAVLASTTLADNGNGNENGNGNGEQQMALTKIRASRQILAGSIFDAQIAANAAIATSKLAEGLEFLKRDGSVALTGSLNLDNNKITNLATPTADGDAANKAYVDGIAAGLDYKESVVAATTADINLAVAPATIDGVSIVAGNRVLVRAQDDATQNGVYVLNAEGALVRATDFDEAHEVTRGAFVLVESGDTFVNTAFVLQVNEVPTVIGTSLLTFVKFQKAGEPTAQQIADKLLAANQNIDLGTGTFEAASATLTGDLDAVNATLTGDLDVVNIVATGDVDAVNATLTGDLGAVNATLTGDLGVVNIVATGDVDAVNATLTGDLDAVNATLTGDLGAVNATLTGDLDAVNATLTGDLDVVNIVATGDLDAVNATLTGDLDVVNIVATGDITVQGNALRKHNFEAVVDPVAGDDSADGYAVGSKWINVAEGRVYICVDATEGAAVWKDLTNVESLSEANFVEHETPAGVIDGENKVFTLANTPAAGSLKLFLNGVLQEEGALADFELDGDEITMAEALLSGDKLRAFYRV